jgi:hypothetical protein
MKHVKHFLAVFVLAALAPFRTTVSQPATDTSSYFPLRIGYQWTYSSEPYSVTQVITDTATVSGHLFYGMSYLGYPPSVWFRTSNDSVFVMQSLSDSSVMRIPSDSNESLLYNFGAHVGDTVKLPIGYYDCTFGNLIILASKEDTVSTPSGTYTHCYHFKHVSDCRDGGMHDSWLAKGIGIVKYAEETFWGSPTYTLDSFRLVAPEGDFLEYYPLQTGDYWQYKTISYDCSMGGQPCVPDTSVGSIEVVGDTLLPNGFHYETMVYNSENIYERLDSLTGCVFRYDSSSPNKERQVDSLFAALGDTFLTIEKTPHSWLGSFKASYASVMNDTILGTPTRIKSFSEFPPVVDAEGEFNYTLGSGFGLCSFNDSWFGGYSSTCLVYAKIDGKEYGTKIPLGIVEHYPTPMVFALFQNYPNPFNPTTTIRYQLPAASHVTLKIYDVLGREVETLVNEKQTAGAHSTNFSGDNLPSGVYFCRLNTHGNDGKDFVSTKKMILLK